MCYWQGYTTKFKFMRIITSFLVFICVTYHSYAIDGYLIKTTDYSLRDKWDNTAGSSTPQIISSDTVFKKQYFFITAIAWNYALDKSGSANVQYSLTIAKPDKTPYLSRENIPLLNRRMEGNTNLQMSDSIIKICFNKDDAFGTYTIQLKISDKVSGKEKKIDAVIPYQHCLFIISTR